MSKSTAAARAARIQEIADGAITRQHFGQSAGHRRLPDGAHEVILRGGIVFCGRTLDEAIANARNREP